MMVQDISRRNEMNWSYGFVREQKQLDQLQNSQGSRRIVDYEEENQRFFAQVIVRKLTSKIILSEINNYKVFSHDLRVELEKIKFLSTGELSRDIEMKAYIPDLCSS